MRDEYDFTDAIRNPYVTPGKMPITIRIDKSIIDYFKTLALETDTPYQTLINSYLADCVKNERKPATVWS